MPTAGDVWVGTAAASSKVAEGEMVVSGCDGAGGAVGARGPGGVSVDARGEVTLWGSKS